MVTVCGKQFENLSILKNELIRLNNLYRMGLPEISDKEFDELYYKYVEITGQHIDTIDGKVRYIKLNGEKVDNLLPMNGINKITNVEDFIKWVTKYNLFGKNLVATPKYDGVSGILNNSHDDTIKKGHRTITIKSQDNDASPVHNHFTHINKNTIGDSTMTFDELYHIGEFIIPNDIFKSKYSDIYKNVRNFVAGKLNPLSESTSELNDIYYIRYTAYNKHLEEQNKVQLLDYLNDNFNHVYKVPYVEFEIPENYDRQVLEDKFYELYKHWSEGFVIDGLIIDVDDSETRKQLGFDTKGNPKFTIAYKNEDTFGDRADVKVRSLQFPIDKDGQFNPCITTDLVMLDGAECGRNIFVDTIDFIRKNKISVGADIIIKRGGQIIPRVYKVKNNFEHDAKVFDTYSEMVYEGILPKTCPYCGTDIVYDENEVTMKCGNENCLEIFHKRVEFFFTQIKAKNIGEKLTRQFQAEIFRHNDAYYLDFITAILRTTELEFKKFENFGERKAEITYESIHNALNNASLALLMSATNLFPNLAETKISWVLEKYGITFDNVEKLKYLLLDDVKNTNGYAEKSASVFFKGALPFVSWYESIKETLKLKENTSSVQGDTSGELMGERFCFTGFRNDNLEKLIIQKGGKIKNSFSLDITVLVVKDKSTPPTTKVTKAEKAGIKIIDEKELYQMINLPLNDLVSETVLDSPNTENEHMQLF